MRIERLNLPLQGRICSACGSRNTVDSSVLRSRPSLLFVLFFGWLFLLIRSAFTVLTVHCRDCQVATRHRATGSKISIVILLLLVFLLIRSIVSLR